MKKTNKFFKICFIIMLTSILLIGCKAELVERTTFTDSVVIVDTYHSDMFMQPITTGKVITFITHPAVYRVTVKYNNEEFSFDNSDLYNKYKDEIGQKISATIQKNVYADDTTEYEVIEIE